jgi:hypothetical protein
VPRDGGGVEKGRGLRAYRAGVWLFAVVAVGLGIAIVAVTAANGGGAVGFLVGPLFVLLGLGRLYLLRRT